MTTGFLRGLHGCFIVFDITDRDSFENLPIWIGFYNDFNKYIKRIMILLGNNSDLENERQVEYEES